jgi:hypothetical protein
MLTRSVLSAVLLVQFVASGIFNGNMSDSVRGQLAAFTGRITSVVLDKTPFLSA